MLGLNDQRTTCHRRLVARKAKRIDVEWLSDVDERD
jgi:hypothetical protein